MKSKFYSPEASQGGESGGSDHPSESHPKKGYPILLDGEDIYFQDPKVTGRDILEKGGKLPLTCFALYIKKKGCDFEKISLDEVVHIADKEVEHFVTKEPDTYPYTVNKDPELTEEKALTPNQILTKAGLDPEKLYLIKVEQDGNEILAFIPDEPIRMHCKGLTFITGEWIDTIDIEEYGKTCREVTPARKYLIKVDKEKFPWSSPVIKAEAIIKMVVRDNPANYNLVKFYSNSPKPVPVAFTAEVDLREKCLVRFVVQPKTQNDGERREFSLPEMDVEFLDAMGFRWEAHKIANYLWLLIHDYILPEGGYQVKQCSVALMIPPAYPASEIDMAYFFPHLKKLSATAIPAISNQAIDGQVYQRWSRHRQPGQWKPGVDCVATHLTLVNNWLENELKR